jgi:hypothetical protein
MLLIRQDLTEAVVIQLRYVENVAEFGVLDGNGTLVVAVITMLKTMVLAILLN